MTHTRNNFTSATKREAFERSRGTCECHLIPHVFKNPCRQPFDSKGIRYEHIDPDAISKRSDLDNCATLRTPCWRYKTDSYDRKVIAKSNHTLDRTRGIRPTQHRPLVGSLASGVKKPLNDRGHFARPVDRNTGREF